MAKNTLTRALRARLAAQERLIARRNRRVGDGSWVLDRYRDPVVTADHVPLAWRVDFNPATNPFGVERLGVNAAFNPGAIELGGRIHLVVRVEGYDRKSFFAVAVEPHGSRRLPLPGCARRLRRGGRPRRQRLRHAPDAATRTGGSTASSAWSGRTRRPPPGDTSSAVAQCGIVRTKDLERWERLPDLVSASPQQRNVVLHPSSWTARYALYTRPQDGFIEAGTGGGIGWALTASMTRADIGRETIIEPKVYHTIKEVKNGGGAPPLETRAGWLHVAHGVRNTAAGLRYVLYAFLCDRARPDVVIARPGRLPARPARGGADRGRLERALQQRCRAPEERRRARLLRVERHPVPRGDDDHRAAARLRAAHARRRPAFGRVGRAARRAHPPQRGVPRPAGARPRGRKRR